MVRQKVRTRFLPFLKKKHMVRQNQKSSKKITWKGER